MKRYDHTQTRRHAIRTVLDEALKEVDYRRYPAGTPPGEFREEGMIVDISPSFGESIREETTLGSDMHLWTDPVSITVVFRVRTDDQQALAERSAEITHGLERELGRYRLPGLPQVDNDEVLIEVTKVRLAGQLVQIVIDDDWGMVIQALEVKTHVHWKR